MRAWVREMLAPGYVAVERARVLDEADILRRALALRRRGKIGVLWADGGKLWISESEFDPHGTRVGVTLGEMAELVESIEAGGLHRLAKPVASAGAGSHVLCVRAGA